MREAGRVVPERITPQARTIVETLAGMPYENLWGNNNVGYLNRNKPAAPALTTQRRLASPSPYPD